MLKLWIDTTLKPLLNHALRVMPMSVFGETLIGYGIACARGAGMSVDDVRAKFEAALAAHDGG